VALARRYGTPLYVFDETTIREQCRSYLSAFGGRPFPGVAVAYAAKAFWCKAMAQLVADEGLHVDVVSGGEIFVGLKAGFPAERMIFHGNNKSRSELEMALSTGVGRIVVDSDDELDLLLQLVAGGRGGGNPVNVLLRIVPEVRAETHEYLATGDKLTKFGIQVRDGQAQEAVRRVISAPGLSFRGFHAHVGSQLLDTRPFQETAEVVGRLVSELNQEGITVAEVDLGGGLGISHVASEQPPTIDEMAGAIAQGFSASLAEGSWSALIVEPGRSLVGEAGITLYTVGVVKDTGVSTSGNAALLRRRIVAVDGGMGDNLRPALYGAHYGAVVANRVADTPTDQCQVVGKYCESGDKLIDSVMLPPVRRGDLLAIPATGAYTHSMASTYNGNPRPAVVFVRDGRSQLVVARETYRDLVSRDLDLRSGGAGDDQLRTAAEGQ